MIISIEEIVRIIIVIAFVGYIFLDQFRDLVARKKDPYAPVRLGFDWESFKFAAIATAPAIILHELAHKFVAMFFGMHAEFFAAYTWLVIGLILKLIGFGFIFFIPGYVAWGCASANCVVEPWMGSLIALAGPATNLILWLGARYVLKAKLVHRKHHALLYLTQQINMFLFFFNMIPIPPFDGFSVFRGLFATFF